MASFEEVNFGFKAAFREAFDGAKSEAIGLATVIKSTDMSEKYAWLGAFPNMKEWLGDRDVKQLSEFNYSIDNKPYEATVEVPMKAIEYDKYGTYKPAIETMAMNAKKFPSQLVAKVLKDGETGVCYDTKPFFAADHVMGATVYANKAVGVLNTANILAGFEFMESIKNAEGVTLGIMPTVLVCGPKNRAAVIQAIDADRLANGATNTTYKMMAYMVLPEITDFSWYLLDISAPLKPFICQIAEDGLYEASNDEKFMKDKALFGTKSYLNAGYGLWQTAFKFSGLAV